MVKRVTTLDWQPIAGDPNELAAVISLNTATDTLFIIDLAGAPYSAPDGSTINPNFIVVDNYANNGTVDLSYGPFVWVVGPFERKTFPVPKGLQKVTILANVGVVGMAFVQDQYIPDSSNLFAIQAAATVVTTDIQQFDANGTWTKPTGVGTGAMVKVQLWGPGGGGGANATGGGAGGGAYVEQWFKASDLPATLAATVPAGGAINTAGGETKLGIFVSAFGGGAGQNAAAGNGGGGGGKTSVGDDGAVTSNGGGPAFNPTPLGSGTIIASNGGSAGAAQYGGGGSRGGSNIAGDAIWGGAGGANGAVSSLAGNSLYGGGGGAGGAVPSAAGFSVYGGNGGASGIAGAAPGGGGGRNAAGGAGRIIVTTFP